MPPETLRWPAVALWVGGKRLQKVRESDRRTLQSRREGRNKNKEIVFHDGIKVTIFTNAFKSYSHVIYPTVVFVFVVGKRSFIQIPTWFRQFAELNVRTSINNQMSKLFKVTFQVIYDSLQ